MIRVFIAKTPLKIGKLAVPENAIEIAQAKNITEANAYIDDKRFQGDDELCFVCTDRKKLVRRYGISDWGKVERLT